MADLFTRAKEHREALIRADAGTARELAGGYRKVHAALTDELSALEARIDRAVDAGKPIGPAMLYQEGRLEHLLEQVDARVAAFTRVAERTTRSGAREAALEGLANGAELVERATPPEGTGRAGSSFTRLRDDAVSSAVAQTAPAVAGLAGLAEEDRRAIADTLLEAVGRGRHPREVARELERLTSMPLTRALTVARTEQLRAYRTASHLTYQANAEALQGWVWISAADSRTCAACFAMHGSTHTLEETMESHPNCRCVAAPWVRPWSAFGLDDDLTPQLPTTGPELFRKLPKAEQDRILGVGGGKAYRAGEVDLEDFITRRSHPLYGGSISRGGLGAARERAGMRAGNPPPGRRPRPTPDAPPRATPSAAPSAENALTLERAQEYLPPLEERARHLERLADDLERELRPELRGGARAMRDSWSPEGSRGYGSMRGFGSGAKGRELSSGAGGAGGRDLNPYAFNAGNTNSWHYRDGKRLNLDQYGDLWVRWSRGDTMDANFTPPLGVEPAPPDLIARVELADDLRIRSRADRHIVDILRSGSDDWRYEPRDREVALGDLSRAIVDGQVLLRRASGGRG